MGDWEWIDRMIGRALRLLHWLLVAAIVALAAIGFDVVLHLLDLSNR